MLEELGPPPGECLAGAVRDLRRDVESSSLATLPKLAEEALSLTDVICWNALERADTNGFCRCARTAAALREFTECAGLLVE